jgi:putative tRNA adenosine deaminase-associated protein
MAYFTAVLTASGGTWRPVDVDLDDAVDVDELAEEVRAAAPGEGAVLVVLEREDEWFALLRVDGDGEARTFVSDLPAAQASRYAELLAPAAESPAPVPAPGEDGEDGAAAVAAPTWAGDTDLLIDLGIPGEELTATAESHDPAGALVQVGERCGFVDLLEALR